MKLQFRGQEIHVFSLVPRTLSTEAYWHNVLEVTKLSDRHTFSGVLIFTGNDVYVEPWLVAQAMIANSASLMPLVAINPVYSPPFTVARMVASLAYAYGRRVFLNLITGTAKRDMEALGDTLTHDQRYARLSEYTTILQSLLDGDLVTFSGNFYQVKDLQLLPQIAPSLRPGLCVAGQSAPARQLAHRVGATTLQMLPPQLARGVDGAQGVNFGIVTRASEAEAWSAASTRFPDTEEGQLILEFSMQNTDSEWKRRLKHTAEQQEAAAAGYWLGPFKNFQADQPFFVGGHEQTATVIADLVRAGVRMFVLDIPLSDAEFANVATSFTKASLLLTE